MVVEYSIFRIRAFVKHTGASVQGLARKAGLPRNRLNGMNKEGWNPTFETIRDVERVIPKEFMPLADDFPDCLPAKGGDQCISPRTQE